MKKVIRRLILIASFSLGIAHAQVSFEEFDSAKDEISDKYMAGPHLVYDCEDKHWVCIADEEKKECVEGRDLSRLKKGRSLKCTYFKSFEDKSGCFQAQLKIVSSATDPVWTCTV